MAIKLLVLFALVCTCIAYPYDTYDPKQNVESADEPVPPLSTIANNEPPKDLTLEPERSAEEPNKPEESDLKTENTWWGWRPYRRYNYARFHSYPIVYYRSYPTYYRSYWPLW